MVQKSREILAAERAVAEANQALKQAELALLRAKLSEPVEPPVGTLLKLRIKFRADDKEYTYTALHTDNGWLISGRRYEGQYWGWEDVLHLADKNYGKRARLAVQGDSRIL
jgi:hypothetical protein